MAALGMVDVGERADRLARQVARRQRAERDELAARDRARVQREDAVLPLPGMDGQVADGVGIEAGGGGALAQQRPVRLADLLADDRRVGEAVDAAPLRDRRDGREPAELEWLRGLRGVG